MMILLIVSFLFQKNNLVGKILLVYILFVLVKYLGNNKDVKAMFCFTKKLRENTRKRKLKKKESKKKELKKGNKKLGLKLKKKIYLLFENA